MSSLESNEIWGSAEEGLDPEILLMSNEELRQRIRLLDNDIRIMRSDIQRINHESNSQRERIKENNEKVKLNKQLPYLVGNVVEILELEDDEDEQDGAATDVDAQRKGKSAVIKTSTRQTIFLPIPGLVDSESLIPNDLVGTNKDSYLILEKLPAEYDSRVKAMEVDEKPTEEYSDIGGLDKQIQELIEAVVLPMTHKEKFDAIGIQPPKGVLLHGPPGTGKTLLARACAKQTDAIFLKLAAPQLVQMFIGDGAKLVRDAFELAKEKCKDQKRGGAIIFIDELDAIGTKRFGGEQSGDREVQRTMLELLNQLDGFTSNTNIKVIAATNRPDVLDPALLRSGRLDRKIELPHPTEEARARILQIHSRKMNVDTEDTNFDELARCTDDFNGAQLKAILPASNTATTPSPLSPPPENAPPATGSSDHQAPDHVPNCPPKRSIDRAKMNVRRGSRRLKQLFEPKPTAESELDLDTFYQKGLRRRTQLQQEITTTLISGGLMTSEGILNESASLSVLRGMHITLSPGEEYENCQKVNAAIQKTEVLSPFECTPSQANDDDDEEEIDSVSPTKLEYVAEETTEDVRRKESISALPHAAIMMEPTGGFGASPSSKVAAKARLHRLKSVSGHSNVVLHVSHMINPLERFRFIWDVVSIGFTFYNAFALPAMTFNTAVDVDGSIRYNRRLAATNYSNSWFIVDVIVALPYGAMFPVDDSSNSSLYKFLKLLRLIRLLRFFRISRILRRIQNTLFIRSTLGSLLKYCMLVTFVSHWFSCIFHDIATSQATDPTVSRCSTSTTPTRRNGTDTLPLPTLPCKRCTWLLSSVCTRLVTKQLCGVRVASATIGFGDISRTNPDERLFSIFAMITGGGIFAYGITNIVELVSSLTIQETRFRQKMDEVNEYMNARELPMKLRMEICEFYHNTRLFRESKLNSEQQILSDLSSKLRSKIALSINDQFLRKFPFLTGSEPNFLMELALNMRMIHFAPLEDVIIEGEIGHEMFSIFRGAVEVQRSGVQIGILGENQYFGEMAILSPDNRRTASVRTLCFCELRILSRNRFLEALALYPAMQTKVAQVAKDRAMVLGNPHAVPLKGTKEGSSVQSASRVSPEKPTTKQTSVPRLSIGSAATSSLARIHRAERRLSDPFIPTRATISSRLNSASRRPSNSNGAGITPAMTLLVTDITLLLEEATRRQDLLINRVVRLRRDWIVRSFDQKIR
ncbi:26s protease regulatory subunit 6a, partial [Globisporangium splendens]